MKSTNTGRLIIIGSSLSESVGLGRSVVDLGYNLVAVVDDADDACAHAADTDLALIDIHLGGGAGGERISQRLKNEHNLPVLMISRRVETGETPFAARAAAADCVQFPIEGRDLQAALQNAIIRHQVDNERRRLDSQRLAAHKAESLGLMSRHLVHDFNNILQAMLGHVQLASRDLPSNAASRALLDQAVQSGLRGAALCRQFLVYSTPPARFAQRSALSSIVSEAQVLLRTIVKKGTQLEYKLADNLPPLAVDPSSVRQILFNLAIHASDTIGARKALLRITTGHRWMRTHEFEAMAGRPAREEGEYAFLELTEDGPLPAPESAARVSDPFRGARGSGDGLELAAVLDLASLHGGAVEVCGGEGKSTSLRVYLPVSRASAAA